MPSERPGESAELPDDLARLPHGRHGLPPEFVERNQRQRLLAALILTAGTEGYNATTIVGVAEAAGVTTRTFYKYFESVEDCYLAAFDAGAELLGERLAAAWGEAGGWPERVRAALAAALDFLADSPQLARVLLTEPFVAGLGVTRRYQQEIARLAPFLREGRDLSPEGAVFPDTSERGLIGSIASQVGRRLSAGEAERLPELLPGLTQFALAPYLGDAEAHRVASGDRR